MYKKYLLQLPGLLYASLVAFSKPIIFFTVSPIFNFNLKTIYSRIYTLDKTIGEHPIYETSN